jgi:predicted GH43/DUF377 family glycosyl hydrolase
MDKLFTRSEHNPILSPNSKNLWEAKKLYNPGAIFHDGKFHLFYRAVGSGVDWKSAIGYAVSDDGENFERFDTPLLTGVDEYEKRGIEDSRITKIDDTFYMAYAAYDGITPRLCVATSKDLKEWTKYGPVFSDWMFDKAGGVRTKFDENGKPFNKPRLVEWSKSGGIFSEKIDGKFWMIFGEYRMWFATSDDGIKWTGDQIPFLAPREGDFFDNIFVEMGPSPIKTEKGWLVLYHGIDDKHCYKVGFLILDLENPREIIFRSDLPIFEPSKDYEMSGIVDVLPGGLNAMQKMSDEELKNFLAKNIDKGTMPKVTFCCGATVVNDELRIFYGASDSVICTATANINDILSLVK